MSAPGVVDMRKLFSASYKVSLLAEKMVAAYGTLPTEPDPLAWKVNPLTGSGEIVEFSNVHVDFMLRCRRMGHSIEWTPCLKEGGVLLLIPQWYGRGDIPTTAAGKKMYPHDVIDLGPVSGVVRFGSMWQTREEVLQGLENRAYHVRRGIEEKQKELRKIAQLIREVRSQGK